jgi:hypothetical protein
MILPEITLDQLIEDDIDASYPRRSRT